MQRMRGRENDERREEGGGEKRGSVSEEGDEREGISNSGRKKG